MVSIHTNAGAISALQALRTINSGMASAQGQVSSGLRIHTAADNAAYWSISTTMRSDSKAVSAVQDALGLGAAKVETAYAGMEAVVGILSEFKSKLVAAKEPGVDKSKIQKELGELKQQVASIVASTSFSGQNWLKTDVSDIYDSDLNRTSVVSSFSRDSRNGVSLNTADFHLRESSLFNSTGGGILQADTRDLRTIGGIRFVTGTDVDGYTTNSRNNARIGGAGEFTFNFSGPITFSDPSHKITFDVIVDKDSSTQGLPLPHDPGKPTLGITIDRSTVDTVLGAGANGIISNYTQYAAVLSHAVTNAGAGAFVRTYNYNYPPYAPIIDRIGFRTQESSGLDGSYVEVANLTVNTATGGAGGLAPNSDFGERGSEMTLTFEPFEVYKDVVVSFSFAVNGEPASAHSFDRNYVNNLLGKDTGKIETADEMVTLLQSLITRPGTIIQNDGAGGVLVKSDPAVDRKSGISTRIEFSGIGVNIEPIARRNFMDIDIAASPQSIDSYIQYIEVVLQKTIDGAAALGSLLTRIDMQSSFAQSLMATIEKGVGRLVDADMNETSTRLKALQTREQLGIQALQIANSNAQNILQLFR
ncbi:flagellin [Ensifer sp. SSB1]|uniref:flagellin N-terminal helical domain-containing protein n=1 Tax=Ensifer sp. SSB1 TaxID=2795385 RepID=UPI001A43D287|nr:flagellin [Ensifer sp. SSB1]MBK5566730.1 flagellin/flagellar hook associated protein [Ensifer sp. SSB1]